MALTGGRAPPGPSLSLSDKWISGQTRSSLDRLARYPGIHLTALLHTIGAHAFEEQPAMLERHVFAQVIGVRCPAIDHLHAVRIDHLDAVAFFHKGCFRMHAGMETLWLEAAVFCLAMMLVRVAVNPLALSLFLV